LTRPPTTEIAYQAYCTARPEGRGDDAAFAVLLVSDICHSAALNWVDEFFDYEPTAGAGLRLVDQALFQGVIYPDDDRLEHWLRTAESNPDTHLQEASHRIRESMAKWLTESQTEQQSVAPEYSRSDEDQ